MCMHFHSHENIFFHFSHVCKCCLFQPADGSTGKHWKLIQELSNINIYTNTKIKSIQYNAEINFRPTVLCEGQRCSTPLICVIFLKIKIWQHNRLFFVRCLQEKTCTGQQPQGACIILVTPAFVIWLTGAYYSANVEKLAQYWLIFHHWRWK